MLACKSDLVDPARHEEAAIFRRKMSGFRMAGAALECEGGAYHAAGMIQDGSDRNGGCALGTRAATSEHEKDAYPISQSREKQEQIACSYPM